MHEKTKKIPKKIVNHIKKNYEIGMKNPELKFTVGKNPTKKLMKV